MSENKKYYYMKVKETFFDSEEMKVLESAENGIEYQNLYLKFCLLSLKSGGALLFKNVIPYDPHMLATVLRVKIDTVKVGISLFQKLGLVEIMDNGVIYLSDIQSLVGKSSTEAERIASYRSRTKDVQMLQGCTPELELELEIELEREKKNSPKSKEKVRKGYGEFENVFLSDDEFRKLAGKYSEDPARALIEKMSRYLEQKGKKYKNYYAALRNWAESEKLPQVVEPGKCPVCGKSMPEGYCRNPECGSYEKE